MARSVQVVNTCRALAEKVEQVILYTPKTPFSADQIFSHYNLTCPSNLTVRFLRKSVGPVSTHKLYNFFLSTALKRDDPDVVFSRHLQTAEYLLKSSVPLLYEVHELFSEKKNASERDKVIEKMVLENAAGIIFISQGLQTALNKVFTLSQYQKVVPSGARVLDNFIEKKYEKGKINRFVYIGTTRYSWKGVDVLIQALDYLPENYCLEIVGVLDGQFLKQQKVKDLMQSGRLVSKGHMPSAKIFEFMLGVDLAVIPNSARDRISAHFTSPLKLIEALGAGVPVVVSDLPSIREIVSEKEAFLVQPDDPLALAAGIRQAFEGVDVRVRRARNGWQRSKEFSWQKRADKIVELARTVFSEKNKTL